MSFMSKKQLICELEDSCCFGKAELGDMSYKELLRLYKEFYEGEESVCFDEYGYEEEIII